jgi:hypothetical protein
MPTINNLKDRDPNLVKIATEIVEFTKKHNINSDWVPGPQGAIGGVFYVESENILKHIEIGLNIEEISLSLFIKNDMNLDWKYIEEKDLYTSNIEDVKVYIRKHLL